MFICFGQANISRRTIIDNSASLAELACGARNTVIVSSQASQILSQVKSTSTLLSEGEIKGFGVDTDFVLRALLLQAGLASVSTGTLVTLGATDTSLDKAVWADNGLGGTFSAEMQGWADTTHCGFSDCGCRG